MAAVIGWQARGEMIYRYADAKLEKLLSVRWEIGGILTGI